MYTHVWSPSFTRTAKRFVRLHPELRTRLAAILQDLETGPFQPQSKLHGLRGKLEGKQAVSLTYDYRIILTLMLTDSEIILLDIGSHDEVYH